MLRFAELASESRITPSAPSNRKLAHQATSGVVTMGVHMRRNVLETCKWWIVIALFALPVQCAFAGSTPLISGSYEAVKTTSLGAQEQIRLQIHLVNHGPSDLSIQRITLSNFSHPDHGGARACSVALPAHASAETTQEFTVRRSEYQMWQRGLRPRLVLQIASPGNTTGGSKSTTVVRLDRVSNREAK